MINDECETTTIKIDCVGLSFVIHHSSFPLRGSKTTYERVNEQINFFPLQTQRRQ